MTVAFPWSGGDVNALVPMSGRAAVPNTPAGAGFNWSSLVGRISGYTRPVRGGFRGLGQAADVQEGGTYVPPSTPSPTEIWGPGVGITSPISSGSVASAAASGAPWWASLISGGLNVGSQIASYQLNPLYQKQTFYQTPQGAVYASNIPTGSVIPGLTTGTGASLLPILLIGGVLFMFMAMKK